MRAAADVREAVDRARRDHRLHVAVCNVLVVLVRVRGLVPHQPKGPSTARVDVGECDAGVLDCERDHVDVLGQVLAPLGSSRARWDEVLIVGAIRGRKHCVDDLGGADGARYVGSMVS